jgi:hypothetical protein
VGNQGVDKLKTAHDGLQAASSLVVILKDGSLGYAARMSDVMVGCT